MRTLVSALLSTSFLITSLANPAIATVPTPTPTPSMPTDMKQACEAVGQKISDESIWNYYTNDSWVAINSPSFQTRKRIYGEAVYNPMYRMEQAILNPRKTMTREETRKMIYTHTSAFLPFFVRYGVKTQSYSKAIDVSEPLYYHNKKVNGALLLASVWTEVYSDPRYVTPLLALALRLSVEMNLGRLTTQDFQTDLEKAFFDSGVSAQDSRRMAWNILGLYGSQGAYIRVFSEMFDHNHTGLGLALTSLSYLIQVIDAMPGLTHRYSLPTGMKTQCVIGKPYHFWMAAYLAHRLREKGQSIQSAADAAFSAGKAYEYYSTTNGRAGKYIRGYTLVHDPLYSTTNNGTRLDLTLDAAGAAFGACTQPDCATREIDLDQILRTGIQSAQEAEYTIKGFLIYNPYTRHQNLNRVTASEAIFKEAMREKFHHRN